jgi:hypothetical protein
MKAPRLLNRPGRRDAARPPGPAPDTPAIQLRGVHRPRPIRFAGLHQLDDWLVKLYGIALPGKQPGEALMDAALRTAERVLPRPARGAGRYGVGFVVVHEAADFGFVLIDWWYGENEIHQQLFSSELSHPTALAPHFNEAIGCVWELCVTDFERRAWIQDVLANPSGPDIGLYLTRRFNADV